MKKGFAEKHWKAIVGAQVIVFGAISTFAWQNHFSNEQVPETPAPEPELSVDVQPPEIKPKTYNPTIEEKFALTIDYAHEKYSKAAKDAIYAYEITGIDPFVVMGLSALENNFGSCDADHDAQGCKQIQSGTLVTWLHRYADEMHFFKTMDNDDPRKIAVQTLLKDRSSLSDGERGKRVADPSNDDPKTVKIKTNRLTADQYQILSDLRLDNKFSAEIAALEALRVEPMAHSKNFTGTFTKDLEKRNLASATVYIAHNQGDLDTFMMALENISRKTETIADSPYLASINKVNVEQNPRIFPNGIDSFVGCTEHRINSEIDASMGSFNATYQAAELVLMAGGGQELISQTWPQHKEITYSPRPLKRPDALVTFEIEKAPFVWEDTACNQHSPAIVFESPRPQKRPAFKPSGNNG